MTALSTLWARVKNDIQLIHQALFHDQEGRTNHRPHIFDFPVASRAHCADAFRGRLADIQAEELRLATAEEALRGIKQRLWSDRMAIERALTPAGSLLPEVLLNIFSFIPPSETKSVLAVSQVCHFWRAAAFRQRDMWSLPDWNYWAIPRVRYWIERAQGREVDVHLDSVSWSVRNWMEYPDFHALFEETSFRWRSLTFNWTVESFPSLPEAISMDLAERSMSQVLDMDLPQLRTVTLHHIPEDSETHLELNALSFELPALRHLDLYNVRWSNLSNHVSNLEELVVGRLDLSANKWGEIFEQCQNLIKLVIKSETIDEEGSEISTDGVELPSLRELQIQESEDLIDLIEGHVELPNLQLLSLTAPVEFEEFISRVAPLCSAAPTIKSLSLCASIEGLGLALRLLSPGIDDDEPLLLPALETLNLTLDEETREGYRRVSHSEAEVFETALAQFINARHSRQLTRLRRLTIFSISPGGEEWLIEQIDQVLVDRSVIGYLRPTPS